VTTQLITILAAGFFAAALVSCTLAVLLSPKPMTMAERLTSVGAPQPPDPDEEPEAARTLEQIELSRSFVERVIMPLLQGIARAVGQRLPGANPEGISVKLAMAGAAPSLTVETFVGLKVAAVIMFAGIALLLQIVLPPLIPPPTPLMAALWSAVSGIAGFFLPDLWLRDRTKRRQKAICRVLPDMVDLISVSVEAGLAFDTALMRISQKARNPLTQEFEKYLLEMQLGKPRREALRQIQVRSGLDDLNAFIGAVIQADQLGVSMAKMLRVQSEQLRVRRRQCVEQLAQKAPLKMLFPMILFIFPAVFVVILGPAARQLLHIGG
jgi:tight adherence protein C